MSFDRARLRANGQWDYENNCPLAPKPMSPYEVPVMSVADAPRPHPNDPALLPYEQTQLRSLLNQFNAAPARIRDAFLLEVTPSALAAGRPSVVRLHG